MKKITYSILVFFVSFTIGLSMYDYTNYLGTNPIEKSLAQVYSAGEGFYISPDIGYNPKTGEKYYGFVVEWLMKYQSKDPCLRERKTIENLRGNISTAKDPEIQTRLEKQLKEAEKKLSDCLKKNPKKR